jgi:hypothetical protein
MRFEVIGARGRPYGGTPAGLSPGAPRVPRPEHLALFGTAPDGGLAGLPWAALGVQAEQAVRRTWFGDLTFTGEEDAGPPAKLVLYRFRRARAEVPFEFRNLPLP